MATIIPNAGAAGWESGSDMGQMYTQGLLQGIRSGMEAATAKNLKLMDQLNNLKMIEAGLTPAGSPMEQYNPNQTQRDILNAQAQSLRQQLQTAITQGRRDAGPTNSSQGTAKQGTGQTQSQPATNINIPSFGKKIIKK